MTFLLIKVKAIVNLISCGEKKGSSFYVKIIIILQQIRKTFSF